MEDESMEGPSDEPQFAVPVGKPKRKILKKLPQDPPEEISRGYKTKNKWSVTEKKKLLYAVKKYGWRNTDKLVPAVETKTQEQIERFLGKAQKIWKRLSQMQSIRNAAPVEVWLERSRKISVRKPYYARSLSKAFSMIAQHETFPTPNSPLDPNYSELYGYFANLLRGNIPTELCEGNRRVVLRLLEMVASILKGTSWVEEKKFFSQSPQTQAGPSNSCDAGRNASATCHDKPSSSVTQMDCENMNDGSTGSTVKVEPRCEAQREAVENPLHGDQFEDLKRYVFTDDPELDTLNPFRLPFDMFTRSSAKVEKLLLKQNLLG